MNESIELYDKLTQGERKLISQQLKKDGKTQLTEIYEQLKSGTSIEELYESSTANKTTVSLLSYQLKEFMIKELANSKRATVIEIELRSSISEIEFLKSKFLNNQALKKINKLKSKLLEHERYMHLQELILIEIEIQYFQLSEKDFKLKLKDLVDEYDLFKEKNGEYYSHKVHFYKQLAGIHNNVDDANFNNTLEFNSADNRSAHYFNMRSKLIDHLTSGKLIEAETISDELLDFTALNKHEMDRVPFQKMDVYFMTGLAYLLSNKMDKYEQCVAEVKLIDQKHDILNTKFEERINYLKWVSTAIGRTKDHEKELLENYRTIKSDISLEYEHRIIEQISNYYIRVEEFRKANKWNREILNKSKKNQRSEFYKRAEIRAIYISVLTNKDDNTDLLTARFIGNKSNAELYGGKLISLLRSKDKNKDALLLELSRITNFWSYSLS
ncbi:MAG: hypothetical protein HRT57_00975 [Crocinitomicaceae bacterium]|nr:hypothetical protein [Crocinitomicaceae bacterium]